ncbi:MAG: branched-chain amino acid transport system substrate-binding protein [Solirubrobacteraceae bacterium]|nr:branched-chain amino acid transport system substrate-binding protein [Solirubrobacteraceae bacterium]
MAAALLAGCGGSSSGSATSGNTIPIGAVFSLTGPGGVYGPQQKNAVGLAVDQVNAKGGIAGKKLAVTILDDGSDKQQSAQATQRLIQQNNVVALLGPTLSNSAVAAHPIADRLRTPMLAVSTTGLHIVGDCPYPCTYIFRDSLGEATAIPANIKTYVAAAHPRTAVLLYPNDDKFSADGAAVVQQSVAASGIRLLGVIQFTKAEADLSPYVTQAVQKHPDVIFITSLGAIPSKIMIEARQQGFKGKFLGGNGFNTAAVSKAAGAAGAGAQSASGYYRGNQFPTNTEFVAAYQQRYGAPPDQFAAQAYTGVLVLADALRRAGVTGGLAAERGRVRSALEAASIDTPLGPFRFTPTHDVSQTIWIIAMDGHGGFRLVSSVKH